MVNDEHTSRQYDAELESVRERVLLMGEMAGRQVRRAIDVLTGGDVALIESIVHDDQRVNALEIGVDESCTQIIARRQPTANDLRLVMMVVKTISDLERIGDEAKKIAVAAKNLSQNKGLVLPRFNKLKLMTKLVLDMLVQSMDAFAKLDVSGVAQIVRRDEQVDEEFRAFLRYLTTFMIEDPRTISSALEILLVANALERIGDHARNISEYVVYMVKGHDVRHITVEEIERAVWQ